MKLTKLILFVILILLATITTYPLQATILTLTGAVFIIYLAIKVTLVFCDKLSIVIDKWIKNKLKSDYEASKEEINYINHDIKLINRNFKILDLKVGNITEHHKEDLQRMKILKLADKEIKNLLLELVNLDKEFNLTVSKIEATEVFIDIFKLEEEIELIFDRQKEIYELVSNSLIRDRNKKYFKLW